MRNYSATAFVACLCDDEGHLVSDWETQWITALMFSRLTTMCLLMWKQKKKTCHQPLPSSRQADALKFNSHLVFPNCPFERTMATTVSWRRWIVVVNRSRRQRMQDSGRGSEGEMHCPPHRLEQNDRWRYREAGPLSLVIKHRPSLPNPAWHCASYITSAGLLYM